MKRIIRFLGLEQRQPQYRKYSLQEARQVVRRTKSLDELKRAFNSLDYLEADFTEAENHAILDEIEYQLVLLNNIKMFFKSYYPTVELYRFIKVADWEGCDTIYLFLQINKDVYLQKGHSAASFELYATMIDRRKMKIKQNLSHDKAIG